MHDANLSDRGWDTVVSWTRGAFDEEVVVDALRRLERPQKGGGLAATSPSAFFLDDQAVFHKRSV